MKGQVLDYSAQTNTGVISGADGFRYAFVGPEWRGDVAPSRGVVVDFEVHEGNAVAIYRALPGSGPNAVPGSKDKVAAGLLALFLGALGVHKFYLGYTGPGLVYLLVNTVGWIVTIFFLGIPNFVLAIMAFVEGIIYLTKTDEEFEQTYVIGNKPWF